MVIYSVHCSKAASSDKINVVQGDWQRGLGSPHLAEWDSVLIKVENKDGG